MVYAVIAPSSTAAQKQMKTQTRGDLMYAICPLTHTDTHEHI